MWSIESAGMIEGSTTHWPLPWPGKRMPSIIISERVAEPVSRPRRLTLTPLSTLAPDCVATGPGETLAAGKDLNRSAVVRAPVIAKSDGLRLVTGTPTAAVPRISEPVISTVSGISSAWATSPCARASPALAMAKQDAVPSNAANLAAEKRSDPVEFMRNLPHFCVETAVASAARGVPRSSCAYPRHTESDCSPDGAASQRLRKLLTSPTWRRARLPAVMCCAHTPWSGRVVVFRPGSQCRLRPRGETLSGSRPPNDHAPTVYNRTCRVRYVYTEIVRSIDFQPGVALLTHDAALPAYRALVGSSIHCGAGRT